MPSRREQGRWLGGAWLWRALLANHWQKLLSIVLAGAIWLYVQGEEVQEARLMAQIAWNVPPDLLPEEPLPTSASLTVSGTRSAIRRARGSPVRVVVDLSEMGIGAHEVDLESAAAEGLPSGVEVAAVAPSTVKLSLDEVAVTRVKIEPSRVGDPAEGWEIASVTVEPKVVEVRGPRSATSGLREVFTRPLDVSGLAVTTVRPVELDLPRGVSLASDAPVRARVEVTSRIEERRFEDVQVYVWGAQGWRVSPPRISVLMEGPAVALRSLGSEDVAAFVHLPDPAERDRYEAWLGEESKVRVQVMHPGQGGVKVVAITPPSIVVERP